MAAESDPAVRLVAGRRLPVATYEELLGTGLSRAAIRHRVRRGWLRRAHRGVYFVGPGEPPPFAAELAAVLACGEGAALSHLAAGRAWRALRAERGRIDVTVPGGRHPRLDGVHVHRVKDLHPDDVRTVQGIRTTAPGRTLIDLASLRNRDALEEALDEMRRLRLVTETSLSAALNRAPRRHGAAHLRALLDERGHRGFTRSPPERGLLRLLRAAGLDPPQTNAQVLGYEVDAAWPDLRVCVEMDSAAFHTSPRQMDADRERDQRLDDADWRVVRVTARQLARRPERVVARVAEAQALSRAAGRA
jgi:very-short-patch-repair endonuclease